jgi:hypothetical protein
MEPSRRGTRYLNPREEGQVAWKMPGLVEFWRYVYPCLPIG